MDEPTHAPRTPKANITRTSLVLAAAALLREQGPQAVTYRKTAKWAGAAASSVGYYFHSASELLDEAARYNIQLWTERAEKTADMAEDLSRAECRQQVAELVVHACLPDESVVPVAHYAQLTAAVGSSAVVEANRTGRALRDAAVARILAHADVHMSPQAVSALVDGAAIAAIAEGKDAQEAAIFLVNAAIEASNPSGV